MRCRLYFHQEKTLLLIDELQTNPYRGDVKKIQGKPDIYRIAKNRHISIRLSEKDIILIRAKALELGLPYQTLIGSILHQYAEGKVKTLF